MAGTGTASKSRWDGKQCQESEQKKPVLRPGGGQIGSITEAG